MYGLPIKRPRRTKHHTHSSDAELNCQDRQAVEDDRDDRPTQQSDLLHRGKIRSHRIIGLSAALSESGTEPLGNEGISCVLCTDQKIVRPLPNQWKTFTFSSRVIDYF